MRASIMLALAGAVWVIAGAAAARAAPDPGYAHFASDAGYLTAQNGADNASTLILGLPGRLRKSTYRSVHSRTLPVARVRSRETG